MNTAPARGKNTPKDKLKTNTGPIPKKTAPPKPKPEPKLAAAPVKAKKADTPEKIEKTDEDRALEVIGKMADANSALWIGILTDSGQEEVAGSQLIGKLEFAVINRATPDLVVSTYVDVQCKFGGLSKQLSFKINEGDLGKLYSFLRKKLIGNSPDSSSVLLNLLPDIGTLVELSVTGRLDKSRT